MLLKERKISFRSVLKHFLYTFLIFCPFTQPKLTFEFHPDLQIISITTKLNFHFSSGIAENNLD